MNKVIAIIIAIVLVVGGGGGYYFYFKNGTSQNLPINNQINQTPYLNTNSNINNVTGVLPNTNNTVAPQQNISTIASFHCKDLLSDSDFQKATGKNPSDYDFKEDQGTTLYTCSYTINKPAGPQNVIEITILQTHGIVSSLNTLKQPTDSLVNIGSEAYTSNNGKVNVLSSNKQYIINVEISYFFDYKNFGDSKSDENKNTVAENIAKIIDANLGKY